MYFDKEIRGHRSPFDVSDQQRCHVTEARKELDRQEHARKLRAGRKVRLVR